MKASPEMKKYFERLEKDCLEAYKKAGEARKAGIDPSSDVQVTLAKNLSERVIGLIGVMAPQLKNTDAPKRIQELEQEYGALDWRVALKIAEEVAEQKFCEFKNKKEAIETGIRVGFAYVTVGVVSAPIEGFTSLEIKKRNDGKGEYFCLNYAGPIRNAGGTAAAVSVLIGDHLRKKFGYAEYDPTEKEVKRCHAELTDYNDRVTNLQYFPSEEESGFLMKHLPVEIGGEPSEKWEVSNANLKDLPRIKTNIIRSGYCLIHSSCVPLKAPKLWAKLQKWGGDFDMSHWRFLEKFLGLQKKSKAKGGETKKGISPDYTYIKDLVSGRPVLSYPLASGGFRIRYGRGRNSGFSAQALHPATMHVLDDFVATATQLKVERPGKAAAMAVCDSIDGPIVKLEDGSVLKLRTEAQAKKVKKNIAEILYLGDVLVNYGDFFDRAHPLVPPGYCEEFWLLEAKKAAKQTEGHEPETVDIGLDESIRIAKEMNIPLYPEYTYYWNAISKLQLLEMLQWMSKAGVKKEPFKLVLPKNPAKRSLELAGVPHKFVNNTYVVIEGDYGKALLLQLGLIEGPGLKKALGIAKEAGNDVDPLTIINNICSLAVRDKCGTFMGARMGRPEKAKMRKLKGSPHCLFPVGEEGGRHRSIQGALEKGVITSQFRIFSCKKCDEKTLYPICIKCDSKTETISEMLSGKYGEKEVTYKEFKVPIRDYFRYCLKLLDSKIYPDVIKGVRGTSSKEHHAEHLAKGILRAMNGLYVNKDGTIRYDCSEIPLTHFKPEEVGVEVKTLRKLGYTKDVEGKELTEPGQILELKPQDIVIPASPDSPDEPADDVLYRTANFIDELLVRLYKSKPYYNLRSKKDLVGQYVVGLAPHTSAGMLGRIIGFSKAQGFLAHPLLHAAMRRDCLHGDSYVRIEENGTWKNVKIGEFAESQNPLEEVDSYGTRVAKVENVYTLAYDIERKRVVKARVKEVSKHTPQPLLRLRTENGRTIKVTKDHLFFVEDKGKILTKKAEELELGDKVSVPFKFDIEEQDIEEMSLAKHMDKAALMVRDVNDWVSEVRAAFGSNILAESLGFTKKQFRNYVTRNRYPYSTMMQMQVKEARPFKGKIAVKRDKISLPGKIPINEEVLYFVGLYIAEGFCRQNKGKKSFYQVSVAATEPYIRRKILQAGRKYFNLKPSELHEDHITFSSKILHSFFTENLRLGRGAHEKRIPEKFLSLPKRKLAALLRGYFDGDGSVSTRDLRVCADTVSEGLLADLSFALGRFGIYFRRYEYETKPGRTVREFYERKGREVPAFKATKITIPSDFCKKFAENIGFCLRRKQAILEDLLEKREPRGTRVDVRQGVAYLKIKEKEALPVEFTYCLNVEEHHNFIANEMLVHNCDGDESCLLLLMDAFLNFSPEYLPNSRGATMDAPLVLTYALNPAEVDDMIFNMDVAKEYPLELYEAAMHYKMPWEVKIPLFGDNLGQEGQFEGMGYTHETATINAGVLCSSYKTLPSMDEKLHGQMELAAKIRAVDKSDVARLVIEKHFIRDTKGNLRKFSQQQFRCVNCNEKFRRPPLQGRCTECHGKIIFTVSEGFITKYLEPSIALAEKYDVPVYLKQSLELLKRRVEDVFGKDKERQEALSQWVSTT